MESGELDVRKHLLGLGVVLVLFVISVEARELCVVPGCKDRGCMEGLRFPNGEIGYGRYFDCCEPGGRGWYAIIEHCNGGNWPRWWDHAWLDVRVPFDWTRYSLSEQRWNVDLATVDFGLHAPPIAVGGAYVDPVFRGGIGRADVSLDSAGRLANFRSSGTLFTAGADVVIEPCAKCVWSLEGGVQYRSASDFDYSAIDTTLTARYAFLNGRLRPTVGVRHTNVDARVAPDFADGRTVDLDVDRFEVVGGVDIGIGRLFTARLEHSAAGDDHRSSASLQYHFPRRRPAR